MTPHVAFPAQPHWSADQLADAVPPRLHELFAFDATTRGDTHDASANASRLDRPRGTRSYLRADTVRAPFRVG